MFRFKKNPVIATRLPDAISMEDGEKALAKLRDKGRANLDRYLEEIDPERLFAEPIGSTPDCLRLDDLDTYSAAELAPGKVPAHVLECEECRQTLRLYQAVKEQGVGALDLTPAFVCLEVNPIDLCAAPVSFGLTLKTAEGINLEPIQISVQGVFDQISCDLEPVECDDLAGSIYTAKCLGTPSRDLLNKIGNVDEFMDWIQISGRTRSGRAFKTSDLVRFQVRRAGLRHGDLPAGLTK